MNSKECKKCKKNKDLINFRKNRRSCKDCEREYGRKYRRENPEKSKNWVKNNSEKMQFLQHKWYINNKEKINGKFRDRYKSDIIFKKIKNYRTALNHIIGGKQKTNKYIKCSKKHLLNWIEFCFTDNMSFKNYGKIWVVDHVIPLNENIEFDILSCWYNIMPVLNKYNLKKNKYIDPKQLLKHKKNLIEFNNILNRDFINKIYIDILAKYLDAGTSLEL